VYLLTLGGEAKNLRANLDHLTCTSHRAPAGPSTRFQLLNCSSVRNLFATRRKFAKTHKNRPSDLRGVTECKCVPPCVLDFYLLSSDFSGGGHESPWLTGGNTREPRVVGMTQQKRGQAQLPGIHYERVTEFSSLGQIRPRSPTLDGQLDFDSVVDLTTDEPRASVLESPGIRHRFEEAPQWKLAAKRGMDIVGATTALIVLTPLMLLTALAVVLTSRGPVFFAHDRVGYMGRRFRFLKFRSMCHDAEDRKGEILQHNHHDSGPIFKARDDPRMTRIGKLIRRFSIDELPQLFHVLSGEMSLVGPRPLPYEDVITQIPEDHLNDASRYTTRDLQRLTAKPGMTCIWQVSGRSELDYDTWVAMDLEYIEDWSLWLDLKLLARTIPAVLSGRGAY
jgi:lipopolysaccharide/colanic/teichoic acid biosynthesis glycosyltransferase